MLIEVIKPSFEILSPTDHLLQLIERAGRTCYKSEDRITDTSAEKFIRAICRNNHESVLEHGVITAKIICDRSSSHQLVRHRIASYSQESQRYVNYSKQGFQMICPPSIGVIPGLYTIENELLITDKHVYTDKQKLWLHTIAHCCQAYLELLTDVPPEDARSVLPNATKTEVVATYNLREWRHIFSVRCTKHAQWQIRNIMKSILVEFNRLLPAVFEDQYNLLIPKCDICMWQDCEGCQYKESR